MGRRPHRSRAGAIHFRRRHLYYKLRAGKKARTLYGSGHERAAERDGAQDIPALRVDGGMSANPTFIQALADASQKPVEVSPVLEATTLGAAFLAGLAVGTWSSFSEIADIWAPRITVEPGPPLDRDRWSEAVRRSQAWIPELSGLDF